MLTLAALLSEPESADQIVSSASGELVDDVFGMMTIVVPIVGPVACLYFGWRLAKRLAFGNWYQRTGERM